MAAYEQRGDKWRAKVRKAGAIQKRKHLSENLTPLPGQRSVKLTLRPGKWD
ncbi:hypothetical protein [Chromobacterium sphagni]|uniref:hypothetical protein n=1 Tax=Chromobacterium sphagni TaxID=1903179 RepID=UPI0013011759|nr:hypothetical protein [Chromobacterium sphagni]